MQKDTASGTVPQLHRALNLKDLVLLNISAIVSLSSLAQVAQFGFASLPLYLLAILTFLIPSGMDSCHSGIWHDPVFHHHLFCADKGNRKQGTLCGKSCRRCCIAYWGRAYCLLSEKKRESLMSALDR